MKTYKSVVRFFTRVWLVATSMAGMQALIGVLAEIQQMNPRRIFEFIWGLAMTILPIMALHMMRNEPYFKEEET